MRAFHFANTESNKVLIQMVDDSDFALIDDEIGYIKALSDNADFHLIAIKTDNWNDDLSPYKSPAVFGHQGFGDGADRTLGYIENEIINPLRGKKLYLGGYSLSGLFSLWSAFQTDAFLGIAGVSPSLWFPGFLDYALENRIKTKAIYLSLGDREEKTRNPVMAEVGNAIRSFRSYVEENNIKTVLEWNKGNHFQDSALRTAKGFAWLLQKTSE